MGFGSLIGLRYILLILKSKSQTSKSKRVWKLDWGVAKIILFPQTGKSDLSLPKTRNLLLSCVNYTPFLFPGINMEIKV